MAGVAHGSLSRIWFIGRRLLVEARAVDRIRRIGCMAMVSLRGDEAAPLAYDRFGFRVHGVEMLKAFD
jgi:hypothetical protein